MLFKLCESAFGFEWSSGFLIGTYKTGKLGLKMLESTPLCPS